MRRETSIVGTVLVVLLVLLAPSPIRAESPETLPPAVLSPDGSTIIESSGSVSSDQSGSDFQVTASFSCTAWNESDNRAYALCDVFSGQVRLRADCRLWPDQYSGWVGVGTWLLRTGICPFGFGGPPIIEARG